MGADDGVEVFPVWPAEEYAILCTTGVWKEYSPRAICLESFLAELIPSLRKSETLLGVFPTPSAKAIPSLDSQAVNPSLSSTAGKSPVRSSEPIK